MHKLFSFLLVAAAICNTPQAWSAQSVPYTSELGTPYGISSEWYNTRGNGAKAWSNVTGDFGGQWGNTVVPTAYNMSIPRPQMPTHGSYPPKYRLKRPKTTTSPFGCALNFLPRISE